MDNYNRFVYPSGIISIERLIFRAEVPSGTAQQLNQISSFRNKPESQPDINPLPFHMPTLSTDFIVSKTKHNHTYSRFVCKDKKFFINGKCYYINKRWYLDFGVSKSAGLSPEMSLGQVKSALAPFFLSFSPKMHQIEIANHCTLRMSEELSDCLFNQSINQRIQKFEKEQVGPNTYINSHGNHVSSKTYNVYSTKSTKKPIHFSFYNLDERMRKFKNSTKMLPSALTNFEYTIDAKEFIDVDDEESDDLNELQRFFWVDIWLSCSRRIGFKPKSLRYRNLWKNLQDEITNSLVEVRNG